MMQGEKIQKYKPEGSGGEKQLFCDWWIETVRKSGVLISWT